jgi:DNA-binding CsgD family transcriptional regulator
MDDTEDVREPIVLSEREWEIIRHVGQGESNAEIADVLRISPATVHTLLDRIYTKLGLRGKAQLADWHGVSQCEGARPDQS